MEAEMELYLITEMDNVFHSDGKGNLTHSREVYSPEWPRMYDDSETDEEIFASVVSAGWIPLKGFSGQYRYNGPIMHASEYIGVGCGLHKYILETEGYYVCVPVEVDPTDDDDDPEPAGWAILYREEK